MPLPAVLVVIASLLGVGIATAVTVWHKILKWAEQSLFPWIEKNLPSIADKVRQAFAIVDKYAAPIRKLIKDAWTMLREYLLKQIIILERQSDSQWLKIIISWVIKSLPSGEKVPAKVTTEEVLSWDELPPDVRAARLRWGVNTKELNIAKGRDDEMEMVY
jgi:hypothetical protein